jgi:hypothetical protein
MKNPLLSIQMPSCYGDAHSPSVFLPKRMAKSTPDTLRAMLDIAAALQNEGGDLILSDLFRSYDMQWQAYVDYRSGKKKAFSPPPGGSLHEAGRAFDIDLSRIGVPLATFWEIAQEYGVFPIIDTPNPNQNEAWHFDCRGSHALVYRYYAAGQGNNLKPYEAMAASAILSVGLKVDRFRGHNDQAFLQSGLIRLGYRIGNMDGILGPRTRAALDELGIASPVLPNAVGQMELLLQERFPNEYSSSYLTDCFSKEGYR